MIWILVVVLLVLALGGAPGWGPYQHGYGWGPSGLVGVILIILVILLVLGRI